MDLGTPHVLAFTKNPLPMPSTSRPPGASCCRMTLGKSGHLQCISCRTEPLAPWFIPRRRDPILLSQNPISGPCPFSSPPSCRGRSFLPAPARGTLPSAKQAVASLPRCMGMERVKGRPARVLGALRTGFAQWGDCTVTEDPLGSPRTHFFGPRLCTRGGGGAAQPAVGAQRQLDRQARPRLASPWAPGSNVAALFQTVLG